MTDVSSRTDSGSKDKVAKLCTNRVSRIEIHPLIAESTSSGSVSRAGRLSDRQNVGPNVIRFNGQKSRISNTPGSVIIIGLLINAAANESVTTVYRHTPGRSMKRK